MASPKQPADLQDSIQRGYEASHISFRGAILFSAWFLIGVGVILLLVAGVYVWLATEVPTYSRSPLASGEQTVIPPAPRLQPSGSANPDQPLDFLPAAEMARMRRDQAALANGWSVDVVHWTVSIPVEQSMRLLTGQVASATGSQQTRAAGDGQ